MPIKVLRLHHDSDWAALEAEWRSLEARSDGSFFQSWTWVGCRVRERFSDPLLVRAATPEGEVVGLALFGRAGPPLLRRLFPALALNETGRRDEDGVFIEHNAPLTARGRDDLLQPMLATALRHGRLVLSGVDETVLAAAAIGRRRVTARRPAPFIRLPPGDAAAWLAPLSASTRYQLRRSRRRYEAAGPLTLRRAADVAEGLAFLDALILPHQARWTERGRAGAFADPKIIAFHRALIISGLPRGEVELLRIGAAGAEPVGYLYNFRWRNRIYAYQGGFNYAAAGPHQTPGLTCHHLAIEDAAASGCEIYDFLAGEARYKSSLGKEVTQLYWLNVTTPWLRRHDRRTPRSADAFAQGHACGGHA